jgi:hypothetical protein
MHRRFTDALERQISDWEHIRQLLGPNASSPALEFIDCELEELRHENAARQRPRLWGRRATDPKPTLLQLFP